MATATIKPYTKRFREGTSSILTVSVATGKTEFFAPAPFESITTRTEDGGLKFAHEAMGVETASDYLLPAVALGEDGMSHVSATSRTGWVYSRSLTGRSYGDVRALLAESGMWTVSTILNPALYADNSTMPKDSRYGVAPAWERARLVAS